MYFGQLSTPKDDPRFDELKRQWLVACETFNIVEETLNSKVAAMKKTDEEDRKKKIAELVWSYRIEKVKLFNKTQWPNEADKSQTEWFVIHKETETDLVEDKDQWGNGFRKKNRSIPFRFVNDVLIFKSGESGHYLPRPFENGYLAIHEKLVNAGMSKEYHYEDECNTGRVPEEFKF